MFDSYNFQLKKEEAAAVEDASAAVSTAISCDQGNSADPWPVSNLTKRPRP